MDKRSELILARAQILFARDHPGLPWPAAGATPDTAMLARQGRCLTHAEDQLLAEGEIECVDQS